MYNGGVFQMDCNSHIATINYGRLEYPQAWVLQAERKPSTNKGTMRNRLTRAQWLAYLRACGKIKRSASEEMALQGMVPFGGYNR